MAELESRVAVVVAMVSDRAAMESFILVDLFVIDVIEVDVIVALDAFFQTANYGALCC